jgi:2-phosphosulfolactate phosphatase
MAYAEWSGQVEFNRRFEWGPVATVALEGDVVVVVDVLRFTTAVEAATSRGALVYPYRWRDESCERFAHSVGATVAGASNREGLSLSPLSLLALRQDDAVVLPSPNGSTCAVLAAEAGATVIAGCLRNAAAIGAALRDTERSVTVIACGERWPDGSLRPALEDLLGAGALLAHLGGRPSPEARATIAAWLGTPEGLRDVLAACSSGRQLEAAGHADDVTYAGFFGVSDVVPVLKDGAFRDLGPSGLPL